MGFFGATCDIALFKASDTERLRSDTLANFSIVPIDTVECEEEAAGWTSFEDLYDTQWKNSIPEKGEWIVFSYRVDKRKVPAALLSKKLAQRCQEIETARGGQRVSRKEKKDLKEEVRLQLLRRTEPLPTTCDVAVNALNGLVLVTSSNEGTLQNIEDLLVQTFGCDVTRLYPENNVASCLEELYTVGRRVSVGGQSYLVSFADEMTLTRGDGGEKASITAKNDQVSIEAGRRDGFSIGKMRVQIVGSGAAPQEEAGEEEGADAGPEDSAMYATLSQNEGALLLQGVKVPVSKVNRNDPDDVETWTVEKLGTLEECANVLTAIFDLK
ncbi:MAG: recombination-associated protein RdgC [Desulfovibrio sp.]|nr:recombination-associated protein RdgC [Desulfovibrio sp.]